MTAVNINKTLEDVGEKVSDRTVRRRLVSTGLRARIPRKKPFPDAVQCQQRLKLAREHVSWTREQWKHVVWNNETHISIFGGDGVRYVRRRPGEDCIPEYNTATNVHPLSIMVWVCMSPDGVG